MIPYCILVIEDDDDRTFMEQLFVDYHRLMYHEIFKLVHDQWAAEDVMQSTLVRLIDKIPELRLKDRGHLVNYIITASKRPAITCGTLGIILRQTCRNLWSTKTPIWMEGR